MRTINHWIDGSPTAGASTRVGPVFNPATGSQTAEVPVGLHGRRRRRGALCEGRLRDLALLVADPAPEHHVRLP